MGLAAGGGCDLEPCAKQQTGGTRRPATNSESVVLTKTSPGNWNYEPFKGQPEELFPEGDLNLLEFASIGIAWDSTFVARQNPLHVPLFRDSQSPAITLDRPFRVPCGAEKNDDCRKLHPH